MEFSLLQRSLTSGTTKPLRAPHEVGFDENDERWQGQATLTGNEALALAYDTMISETDLRAIEFRVTGYMLILRQCFYRVESFYSNDQFASDSLAVSADGNVILEASMVNWVWMLARDAQNGILSRYEKVRMQ